MGGSRMSMASGVDVFFVQHVHIHDDGEEDVKVIGMYSSRASAEQAIERLKSKPGFRMTLEGSWRINTQLTRIT